MPSSELPDRIARLSSYLEADPTNLSLLLDLADTEHRTGQFEAAYAHFARAAELDSASTAAQAGMAAVRLSQHHFADAAQLYQDLVSVDATAPELKHNLGLALFYLDRFDEAARYLEEAAAGGAANHKLLANCYHHLGRVDDAVAQGELWTQADHGADATGYCALLYLDQGERGKARVAAQQALAQQPDNADAHAVRGALALEDQDIVTAEASFATVLNRRPDDGRAWLGLGLTHLYRAQAADALAAMERAVALSPSHAGTLIALGWTQLTSGMPEAAEMSFRAAVTLDRNFAEPHGGLAAALVGLDRRAEAEQELELAQRLDPANFGAVYAKALLLKQDGRAALADRLIARALDQRPVEGAPPLIDYLTTFLAARAGAARSAH